MQVLNFMYLLFCKASCTFKKNKVRWMGGGDRSWNWNKETHDLLSSRSFSRHFPLINKLFTNKTVAVIGKCEILINYTLGMRRWPLCREGFSQCASEMIKWIFTVVWQVNTDLSSPNLFSDRAQSKCFFHKRDDLKEIAKTKCFVMLSIITKDM